MTSFFNRILPSIRCHHNFRVFTFFPDENVEPIHQFVSAMLSLKESLRIFLFTFLLILGLFNKGASLKLSFELRIDVLSDILGFERSLFLGIFFFSVINRVFCDGVERVAIYIHIWINGRVILVGCFHVERTDGYFLFRD